MFRSFVIWSSLLSIFVVCTVVHRTSLGAGERGCLDDQGDGRRHLESVALLRTRQTKSVSDQPLEKSLVCSSRRDWSPTSRDIVRSCLSAAIQSERGDGQKNLQQDLESLSLGLSASRSVHSSQSSRHGRNSQRDC